MTDDGAAEVRRAARAAGVPVVERAYVEPMGGTSMNLLGLAPLAALLMLLVLLGAPPTRLASTWAWFWLTWGNPLAVVFLLLEPVPLWRTGSVPAARWKLTGGWAFMISLVLTPMLRAAFPGLVA